MWKPFLFFLCALTVSADTPGGALNGIIDWEQREIVLDVSLDISGRGYQILTGRGEAETALSRLFPVFARPVIRSIPVNSSATIGGYIDEGTLSPLFADHVLAEAESVPPFLSPDFRGMRSTYKLDFSALTTKLPARRSPALTAGTLSPLNAPVYTGIIIIADEELPVHGTRRVALPRPSLAPKIWDSHMNLLFDGGKTQDEIMPFYYMETAHILSSRPGGLSLEAEAVAGTNPLRLIAVETFGEYPTDLVIAAEDAPRIISREENRRLFLERKLILVLHKSVLKVAVEDGE